MFAEPDRLKVLGGLLEQVERSGTCLIDENRDIPRFKNVLIGHDDQWEIVMQNRGHHCLPKTERRRGRNRYDSGAGDVLDTGFVARSL